MRELQRLAALIIVSPGIAEQRRNYELVYLCEKAMYVATRIAKRRNDADPELVAAAFAGMYGMQLAQANNQMVIEAVDRCVEMVTVLDEMAKTAAVDLQEEEAADALAIQRAAAEAIAEAEAAEAAKKVREEKLAAIAAAEAEAKAEAELKAKIDAEGNKTSDSAEPMIADSTISSVYKKALSAAGLLTVKAVLEYDEANEAEGGLDKLEGIGKLGRERIMLALKG